MRKHTFFPRILAMALSAAMVLSGTPAIAIGAVPLGIGGEITAFEVLPEKIAVQEVEIGATLSDITLPEALEATLKTESPNQNADSGQTQDNNEEEPQPEDTGAEATAEKNAVKTPVEASPTPEETALFQATVSIPVNNNGEEPQPEDTDTEATAEKSAAETTAEVSPASTEMKLPQTAVSIPVNNNKEELQPEDTDTEAIAEKGAVENPMDVPYTPEETKLPQTTVFIPVTWEAQPVFDGEMAGTYVFMPLLPAEYTLAAEVEAPSITVIVNDSTLSGLPVPEAVGYGVMGTFSSDFSWQQVANDVLNSEAYTTSLFVKNGGPYVSAATGGKVKAWMVNGSSWQQLLDQSTTATYTSLCLDGNGRPYVAYGDPANTGQTKVLKFSSSWASLNPPVPPDDNPIPANLKASYLSLAIAENGTPYLAANQNSMSGRVSVTKHNGSQWEYVGVKNVSEQAYSASLDIYNNTPYVAYCVNDSYAWGSYVTMKKFDGSQWATVGDTQISTITPRSSYVSSAFVSMKISDSGTPYVAYADPGTGNRLMVKKLIGSNWVSVGGGYLTAGEASYISLYVEGDTPYVAYKDGTASSSSGVTVRKFDNISSWVTLGSSEVLGSGNAKGISLFVDNGTPYISFSTNSSVKVMKFAAAPKIPVTISAGSASVTYTGGDIILSNVAGLFTLDAGAGARTYSLEAVPSENCGEGQLYGGTALRVTKAGIFRIGLETAESSTHTAGAKAIATLTVEKGAQPTPSGLGTVNASSASANDGKITGLISGFEYEYKLAGESAYTKVTANPSGEITDLPVGTYTVRYPETPVYSPSADSTPVTVGDATSLTYSATMNPTSYTFPAATVNYAPQAEQQFTITNTGTGTITGISASLDNGDFVITSMVFVTQLAPNAAASISVCPRAGLAAGTHTGTLTITGDDGISVTADLSFTVNKIQTYNSYIQGADYYFTYNGAPALNMSGFFTFGPSNGRRVYTLESGTTGQGSFTDYKLNIGSSGTFIVGLVTEETEMYAQTPKIFFKMVISKGTIPPPIVGAVNATMGSSNGKITGLIANKDCEYKIIGAGGYTTVTTDEYGQITGLPAGTYVVRYPNNDLHIASEDSNAVTIGEDAPPYSAAVNLTSHTFTPVTYGYDPQQAQEFIITNNGTGTITNLSAFLNNGEDFIISMALSETQLAPNATAAVSIRPNPGLSVGTYTDTLSITGDNGIALTIPLTFTVNPMPVVNTAGNTNTKYSASGINLSAVTNLFTLDPNGGTPTYTIDPIGTTGEGTILCNMLTVTSLGTFRIQLVTVETENYTAGPQVTATLIVDKGDQDAPTGLTAVNVTPSSPVSGQITGLIPGMSYEYRNILAPDTDDNYTQLYAGSNGEIMGLPAGTYAVRYPATALCNASPVATVTIGAYNPLSGEKSVIAAIVPANAIIKESTIVATVSNSITSQTINVTVSNGASWKLYGDNGCTQEIANKTMALNTGANTAYIKVTAANGSIKIYTLIITRQSVSDGGSPRDDDDDDSGRSSSGSAGASGSIASIPVTGGSKNKASVDSKGNASSTVTGQNITDAIANAQLNAAKKGKSAGEITVAINVSTGGKDANTVTVNLPKTTQQQVINKKIAAVELTIDRPDIIMGLNNAAITEINKQANADVQISAAKINSTALGTAAKNAIGSRPAYDFKASYKSGKSSVTNFGKGTVYVSIPYTPAADEKVGYLYAVYVDGKGNVSRVPDSAYDVNTKSIIFATSHFSAYGVSYTDPTVKFTDIASHWAKDSIDYVSGRGLMMGITDTAFSPDTAMTREMLVTALGRLAGIDEKSYKANTFTDVKADSASRPYIEWAYSKGILQGISSKRFGPDQVVTREEAALIFANYAKATGYALPAIREAGYGDASNIGSAYKTAVTALQQAGVIMSKTGNRFNPKASATRAEVSTMLHRYVKLVIDRDTAQGWAKNDTGEYLYYKDGKALTGTQTIGSVKYIFESTGVLKTGWLKEGNNWRFYSGNQMLVGFWELNTNGSNKTYYFTKDGLRVSGKWLQIDGKWYYFNADGSLAKSTKIDGYEIDSNGIRKTN